MVMEGATNPLIASSAICSSGRTSSSSRFKQVCVFCGAYSGGRSIFEDAAVELGTELVNRKISLVYGGASVGLMGKVSRAVRDGGQHVTGIIPTALMEAAMGGRETVGEVVQVASMHERKAEMESRADAFIALPGGFGTLEEIMEQITWSQLGIHDKPVGLLNVDGYYDCLLAFLDKAVKEGFIEPSSRQIVVSSTSAVDLMNKLENYDVGGHVKVVSKRSWEMHQRDISALACNNMLIAR